MSLLHRRALAGCTVPEMVVLSPEAADDPVKTCRKLTRKSSRKSRDTPSIKKVSSRKVPMSLWDTTPPLGSQPWLGCPMIDRNNYRKKPRLLFAEPWRYCMTGGRHQKSETERESRDLYY